MFFQHRLSEPPLQTGEPEPIGPVVFDDELNNAVAEVAGAIEQDNRMNGICHWLMFVGLQGCIFLSSYKPRGWAVEKRRIRKDTS